MKTIKQYGLVRVVRLIHPPEHYDGWRVNRRSPHVGDIGTVIDILQAPGLPDDYVVESSSPDGVTIWLGDFDAEELEPIDDSKYTPQYAVREPPNNA